MKYLFVIRSSPQSELVHHLLTRSIERILKKGETIEALFFTDKAAICANCKNELSSEVQKIQSLYIDLAKATAVKLLVCGRAFRDAGCDEKNLSEAFTLSGNAELAAAFANCDKTVEL